MLALFALTIPIQAAPRQKLSGHIPAAVTRLASVAPLAGTKRLNLAIGLPLRNQAELTNLLQQLYDPASPQYHQYLTPAQFTERFGPTEQDYQAVKAFAQANGFTVAGTHPNRLLLDVDASVGDIERAFHLTLRVYRHPKEARTFYAADGEPSLDLAVPVLHVSGLDNYSLPHPAGLGTGSGTNGSFMGNDFRAAYAPGVSLDGSGQSVGLLQFDGYYSNDIANYISQAGISTKVTLFNVLIDGGVSTPGPGNIEVAMDIELVVSMAPGLSRIYVYQAPKNRNLFVDILSRMADDNLANRAQSPGALRP